MNRAILIPSLGGARESALEFYLAAKEWDNQIGNPLFTSIIKRLFAELPAGFAPEAKPYTQFEFDPHSYKWTDKANGSIVDGSR